MTAPRDPAQPDRALIRAFLDGDEDAFGVLYHRHTPRLRMLIIRLMGPRSGEVDDVLQETWLATCRGLHTFNGTAQFSTWLTTIGIRTARSRARLRVPAEAELPLDVPTPPARDSATVIDLERAIAALPDHQRHVLVLHDVEGFTHEEIAAQLGVAIGTSKGTLSRARAALRSMLTEGALHD